MLNKWFYDKGRDNNIIVDNINFFPENSHGFVYKIINNINGKYYIGKKSLFHNKRHKLTKKQLSEINGRGRKPKTEVLTVESDWLKYNGSSKILLKDIKEFGEENFQKYILEVCSNKKLLTYYELKYHIQYDILQDDNCYNDNILGKFYRKDFSIDL